MSNDIIVSLSLQDRDRIIRALRFLDAADATLLGSAGTSVEIIEKLSWPLDPPRVTVGVHGGQVQWIVGNPFPIMICDYDGNECDLQQVDAQNQKCRSWLEPMDQHWSSAAWPAKVEPTSRGQQTTDAHSGTIYRRANHDSVNR